MPPSHSPAGGGTGIARGPAGGEGVSRTRRLRSSAEAAAALAAAGFDEPRRRARNLLGAALGRSAAEMFAHPEAALAPAQEPGSRRCWAG